MRARASAWLHRVRRPSRARQGCLLLGDGGAGRKVQARDRGRQASVADGRRRAEAPDLRPRQHTAPATRPGLAGAHRRGWAGTGILDRVQTLTHADPLVVAGVPLRSRLFLGTGKYTSDEAMLAALEASGCELVTVALRRLDLDSPNKKTILDAIDWSRYRILPNTAGCRTADEAIRIARLARPMELGADAVLVNSAVALAQDPALMAEAIKGGVEAGRNAYLAGRIPKRADASPSSPTEGISRPN